VEACGKRRADGQLLISWASPNTGCPVPSTALRAGFGDAGASFWITPRYITNQVAPAASPPNPSTSSGQALAKYARMGSCDQSHLRRQSRLPPFAKGAKDGAPTLLAMPCKAWATRPAIVREMIGICLWVRNNIQQAGGRFHQSPTYGIPITS
jgi:hypothetical protein